MRLLQPVGTASLARVKPIFRRVTMPSCLVATVTATLFAQGPAPTPVLSPPPSSASLPAAPPLPELTLPHDLTKVDLEPFLDALIPAQLQNRDIAGAVVSVVKDGQLLFAKGYGYADFAAKRPIIAEKTLFRPGSISKVFTAIAVMQLVEEG